MASKTKIKYLVADTTAFINTVQLSEYADNVLTVPDVIKEVRNKRQIRRLCVLPFDLQVREPRTESIKYCVDFAKKTGDYASLSGIDIKVIALTYELEVDNIGKEHLRSEPVVPKVVASRKLPEEFQDKTHLAGWYYPKDKALNKHDEGVADINSDDNDNVSEPETDFVKRSIEAQLEQSGDDNNATDDFTQEELDALFEKLKCEATDDDLECSLLQPKSKSDDEEEEESNEITKNEIPIDNATKLHEVINSETHSNSDEDSNDKLHEVINSETHSNSDEDSNDDWITPKNIKKVKKSLEGKIESDLIPMVACMSTDYALQNVLKQMNLQICALDGRAIKHLRTYILRCYACFKTTSIMTKVFCPNCGNKTLKRVAVSLDENGKQVVHINTRRSLTAKYKNQSLPRFHGGKHSRNPILFEDQPIPRQMPSRVAKTKTDALDEDYIAGFSPFAMRDLDSKSAMLRSKGHLKEWARNNTFEEDRRKKHYNRLYK